MTLRVPARGGYVILLDIGYPWWLRFRSPPRARP